MPTWEDEWARRQREDREKRERADLEYEREEAQRRADRAARDRDDARKRAARERAVAQEEVEYAREAEANAEARADMWQERAGQLVAALAAVVAAWDGVLPDGGPACGVDVKGLGEAIAEARKVLNEKPAEEPNVLETDPESTD